MVERSLSHVSKAEAAAATGADDSLSDVPTSTEENPCQSFNEHKIKITNAQVAHSVDGPRAGLHKYQLQPMDGMAIASLRS